MTKAPKPKRAYNVGPRFTEIVGRVFAQYRAWTIDAITAERSPGADTEYMLLKIAELEERIERFERPNTDA